MERKTVGVHTLLRTTYGKRTSSANLGIHNQDDDLVTQAQLFSEDSMEAKDINPAVARLMRLLERLTGDILGSLAVSVQVGNILICIVMLFSGPAFIVGFFCSITLKRSCALVILSGCAAVELIYKGLMTARCMSRRFWI